MPAPLPLPPRPFRVVCPLRFEQARLRSCIDAALSPDCCGPGASAVEAWVRQLPTETIHVALIGVAGALVDGCPPGTVCVVGEVVDGNGGDRLGSVAAGWLDDRQPLVRAVSTERAVTDPAAKRALGQRTGASVVDLESHAFARTAVERGLPWMVVRVVSDGANDELPPDIEQWTDANGRTRLARVLAHILRRPKDVPRLRRLAAAADDRAFRAVAELVVAAARHASGGARAQDRSGS